MATFQVIKPLIVVRDEKQQQHMLYQDAVFSDEGLDAEHVEMLEDEGFIEAFTPPERHENEGDPDGGSDGPPAKSASKADWVAFAVSQGADEDEADASTKDDLIEKYGA